ncbi:hypothetical protein ES707_20893 [subsurface metagenome]
MGLFELILKNTYDNVGDGRFCRDERFLLSVLVFCNQLVSYLKYLRFTAKVFLKFDNGGVGPIIFKVQYVTNVGAAPAVNGLVGVAGCANIVVLRNEGFSDSILGVIGVLIFIDEQEFETI